MMTANRRNMARPREPLSYGPGMGLFKQPGTRVPFGKTATYTGMNINSGQGKLMQQSGETFGIEEARRVLGDVFADWIKDLNL